VNVTANVIEITESSFAAQVIDESLTRPVVVDFWAAWCGPCKILGPILERMAAEDAGRWLLAKLDVDQNPALAAQFGVQGIPTVIAFRDGQPANRFTGALPEAQVRTFVDSVLPSELDMAAARADAALDRGDIAEAESGFLSVLEEDPGHEVAGVGLATILMDRDDPEAALDVLSRLAKSEEVRRMEAAARLWGGVGDIAALGQAAESGSEQDRLRFARALSVNGDTAEAMQILVDLVGERGETAEDARAALLDLFEVLGQDHPQVGTFRRKLASALF
jgi:putative thioredoxin